MGRRALWAVGRPCAVGRGPWAVAVGFMFYVSLLLLLRPGAEKEKVPKTKAGKLGNNLNHQGRCSYRCKSKTPKTLAYFVVK